MNAEQAILAISEIHNVSRETSERLQLFAELLEKWNKKINLISPATLPNLWERHILDSAQLIPHVRPDATSLVDIGTGGGFPGMIIAILGSERQPDLNVRMIESDLRKSAFLQTASAELGLKTKVIARRIEQVEPQASSLITSRALAPLDQLLAFAERHLRNGGEALFMKGAKAEIEINEALASWSFDLQKIASKTSADAVILKISNLRRS